MGISYSLLNSTSDISIRYWKGRIPFLFFNVVSMIILLILYMIAASTPDPSSGYYSNDMSWHLSLVLIMPFSLIHIALHLALIKVFEKKAYDIGVSLAVLDGISILLPLILFVFLYLLIKPFVILTSITMSLIFILGMIFGIIEAEFRKKSFYNVSLDSNEQTFIGPSKISLWIRKADSPSGSEIKIELPPNKFLFDLIELTFSKFDFPSNTKIGDLELWTEQKEKLSNKSQLSSLTDHQTLILTTKRTEA